jgi:hypothetical protein
MNQFKNTILPILLATIWISVSEFARNEYLLKPIWREHYEQLGQVFPSEPINGAVWGLWSLCIAIAIFIIAKKFSFWQTTFLAWWTGFVLMWLVTANLNVLPFSILPLAIPLSVLEALVASWIIKQLSGSTSAE